MTGTHPHALIVDSSDNVATLLSDAQAGDGVMCGETEIILHDDIPFGHKVALQPIASGEEIIKYGTAIGIAACAIVPGEHVHTNNVLGLNAALRGRER